MLTRRSSGEIQVAPPVSDDKDRASVSESEMRSDPPIRSSFQPNPFFGSQTSLFKK